MSDLHLDTRDNTYEPPKRRPKHDAVIIAGDICQHMSLGAEWITQHKLNQKPVVFVGGNHEFYCDQRDAGLWRARLRVDSIPNIYILQDQILHLKIRKRVVPIFGATLWTDYKLDGARMQDYSMRTAGMLMNDHRLTTVGEGGVGGRWLPSNCIAEHKKTVAQIKRAIKAHPDLVVVTHHAPSGKSVAEMHRGLALNPAYASNLDKLVERTRLWIHGHVHSRNDYKIGNGRVISNPRGYAHEITGFDPRFVVEV